MKTVDISPGWFWSSERLWWISLVLPCSLRFCSRIVHEAGGVRGLASTSILDKINGTSGSPLRSFQWCQNGACLLLRAFIIAFGGRGIIVPFYSVQDCTRSEQSFCAEVTFSKDFSFGQSSFSFWQTFSRGHYGLHLLQMRVQNDSEGRHDRLGMVANRSRSKTNWID